MASEQRITVEEAKKHGCIYCQYRHSFCDHEPTLEECEFFEPGKCLLCKEYFENGINPSVCNDAFDWEGCNNFRL